MTEPILLSAGIELHMQDFAQELRSLDQYVFNTVALPPAVIRIAEEYPDGGIPGARVSLVGSIVSGYSTQIHDTEQLITFPRVSECYMLWQRGVERKLDSAQFSGYGDSDIRMYWFLISAALVRGRVLLNQNTFLRARLRTLSTVRKKHIQLFGENVFSELRYLANISEGRNSTEHETDMLLTQFLVAAAFQNGHLKRKDDVVNLLTVD